MEPFTTNIRRKTVEKIKGNPNQKQQGDVWLERVSEIPKTAKKMDHGVLAHGESGHTHALTDIGIAMLFMEGDQMFLRVQEGEIAEVEHEEHGIVRVPAGDYEVGKVYEWNPFEEEAREVAD